MKNEKLTYNKMLSLLFDKKLISYIIPELNALISYNNTFGWEDSPVSKEEVYNLKKYILEKSGW